MIGQENLKRKIDNLNNIPKFILLTGLRGSDKDGISQYIAKSLKANIIYVGSKVDDIREALNLAYKQTLTSLYVIRGGDDLSIAAKNALLKVTEEPPNKSYFILQLEEISNTLPTLRSRGAELRMDNYSPNVLLDYWNSKYAKLEGQDTTIMTNICMTPGDCDILQKHNIKEFNN